MAGWPVGEGVGYARDRSVWEVEDALSLFDLLWVTEIRTRAALRVIKRGPSDRDRAASVRSGTTKSGLSYLYPMVSAAYLFAT